MSRIAFFALLSHWRHRPLQLLTLILGIALATALWSGVQAINAEARASYARSASILEQSGLSQLTAKDGTGISLGTFAALRRAGWNVSPVIEGETRIGGVRIKVIGIDALTMPSEGRVVSISGSSDLVDFMAGQSVLIVSPATAARLGNPEGFRLRVSETIPDGAAFADISVADRLLAKNGLISRLVVAPVQLPGLEPLESLAPDLGLQTPDRPDMARLTDSFHLNLTAFGFLAFIVGLFIVYSAAGLSFEQRRATFRTLRCLGVSLRGLTLMLVIEIMVLAFISGVLGVVIGYVMASMLLPGVVATLRGLYGAEVSGTLSLRPEWWLAGMGMALAGTALSSLQSLWRVRTMPILASSQPQAWGLASATALRFQSLAGVVLLLISAGFAVAGSGLISGFVVLGALLLGCALLLPPVLSIFLRSVERRSRHAMTHWFWADTRLQLPGLSLALMALLLALSANVGVGTMVSSFRTTFLGWLDQRLVAELYVTARDENEAMKLRAWLPLHSDAVLPIWSTRGTVLGEELEIAGISDHATYRDHWPLLEQQPDVWDSVAEGRGALINEQLWREKKLQPGQELTLPGGWVVTVAGVYSDYGNPKGQVMVGVDALTRHYPDVSKLRYGIRVDPARVQDLKKQLFEQIGLPEAGIIDQVSLKQQSRAVFEQTFVVTGALNVLTLGVAAFAMFASLLTLSTLRLPQLAPVWAMGIRRRNLALLEVLRTFALWCVTFVAAIPVGLALAWVLLSVINVEAFGWKLPMMIFPWDWLRLAAIALVAAMLSVAVPVIRLATINPSDLLRVFANER
ncbi:MULTISPECIES: ABC transporter permease [unclassified Rhizobium]|uniref:ABC transporter permease n=1 Tax=unclassified Rhizobium TaxID=2613769 RepID=UPI00177CE095|nr:MULTISPECIES: ABC transporter permease [unclassified Rhizobium]MBD8688421.1 FtsX-like permease family protein [Rhizobium sp. CFBP 13644]MBD8693077.1 FtsX-like permease family protein [Rhizobium sp. CFBP 13717]